MVSCHPPQRATREAGTPRWAETRRRDPSRGVRGDPRADGDGVRRWRAIDVAGVTTSLSGPSVESVFRVDADGEVAWAAAVGDVQASVAVAEEMAVVVSGSRESGFLLRAFELENGQQRWEADMDDGDIPAQLMTAGDLVVVLNDGTSSQAFEAFEPVSGESLWRRSLSGRSSTGAVEAEGLLVFSDAGADQVVALDPATGEERWTQSVEGLSGKAPVLGDGRVLVDSLTEIHALDLGSGEVAWSVATAGDVDSVVVLGDSVGAISFEQGAQPDMALEVFEGRSGSPLWSFTNSSSSIPISSQATSRGVLVLTAPAPSKGHTVVMLDAATGEPVWSSTPAGGAFGPTIVLAAGDVLVAASDESGQALSDTTATLLDGATGAVVWEVEVPGTVLVEPTATLTTVFLPAETDDGSAGALFALDATNGEQLWQVDLALPPLHSVTTVGDSVLVGSAIRHDLEQ